MNGVDVSPDGRLVASASGDRSVKVWEAATGKLVKTFQGHEASVWNAAVIPLNKTLVMLEAPSAR